GPVHRLRQQPAAVPQAARLAARQQGPGAGGMGPQRPDLRPRRRARLRRRRARRRDPPARRRPLPAGEPPGRRRVPHLRLPGQDPDTGRVLVTVVIRDLLRRAQRGTGGVLLVDGEPGIGTSLLLRDATDTAAGLGFSLAAGAADELGRHVPFFPLRAALCAPSSGLTAEHPGGDLPDDAAWWITQVRAHLEQRAGAGPVLVCLDDLHWAS